MNILVLTDFSVVSKNAFNYALELVNALEGTIFQLHILSPRNQNISEKERIIIRKEAIQKMMRQATVYPHEATENKKQKPNVINLVKKGKFEQAILETSKTHSIDLIVLGTRQKHSLMDYLLGSISTLLIHKSPLPLIIVPEKASVHEIRTIAIATENEPQDSLFYNFISNLSKRLKANVKQVYVFPLPRDIDTKKEIVYNSSWLKNGLDTNVGITIVRDLSVIRGLDYFIKKYQINLLTLQVPIRHGLQKFFHRSITKKMIYQSSIPLLVWNEKKDCN